MRFLVAVKQVPDTANVRLDENGSLIRTGVPSILNPYCENALLRVLSLKKPEDTVAVVTMGPKNASEALRRCIELGADDAYLLTDRDFAGADTWATARTLTAFIRKYENDADLYVFGRQATDGDTGQVPYEVAGLLGIQQFAYADTIEKDGENFVVTQDYESFVRKSRVPRGSVISFGSVNPSANLPSIDGYLRGRSAEIRELGRIDIGLGLYSVGMKGSTTKIVGTSRVQTARRNVKVEITNPSIAAEFIVKEVKKRPDAKDAPHAKTKTRTACLPECSGNTTSISPPPTARWSLSKPMTKSRM